MPTGNYDRYGLTGNPFRELASENLEDVEIFHVNLAIDAALRAIREETFDKENRAVVAIVGEHGAGKTERLLLTAAEAKERSAFVVYFEVPSRAAVGLRGLAESFHKEATARGAVKAFATPSWMKELAVLTKAKDPSLDGASAGKVIARVLNENSPSFLLLNDLHNLQDRKEADTFAKMLQEISDGTRAGVLVMFVCYPNYLHWLTVNHPPLASRINRTVQLPSLLDEEAALLIAKKLLTKRVVEDLDATFPFDPAAIALINRAASGNPRRLLLFSDRALEYGVDHRAYRIDQELVAGLLAVWAREQAPPVTPDARPEPAVRPPSRPAGTAAGAPVRSGTVP